MIRVQGCGFIPTREFSMLPQEEPFQGRDFVPTRVYPLIGRGDQPSIADFVDIETALRETITRQDASYTSGGIFRGLDSEPLGNVNPEFLHGHNHLPRGWQQPDTRPGHFEIGTRFIIKENNVTRGVQTELDRLRKEHNKMHGVDSRRVCDYFHANHFRKA